MFSDNDIGIVKEGLYSSFLKHLYDIPSREYKNDESKLLQKEIALNHRNVEGRMHMSCPHKDIHKSIGNSPAHYYFRLDPRLANEANVIHTAHLQCEHEKLIVTGFLRRLFNSCSSLIELKALLPENLASILSPGMKEIFLSIVVADTPKIKEFISAEKENYALVKERILLNLLIGG